MKIEEAFEFFEAGYKAGNPLATFSIEQATGRTRAALEAITVEQKNRIIEAFERHLKSKPLDGDLS